MNHFIKLTKEQEDVWDSVIHNHPVPFQVVRKLLYDMKLSSVSGDIELRQKRKRRNPSDGITPHGKAARLRD